MAVFPSRDFLRLDDYGKLMVFTLRGGALVTFPSRRRGSGRDAPQHPLPVAPPSGPPLPRGTAADGTAGPLGASSALPCMTPSAVNACRRRWRRLCPAPGAPSRTRRAPSSATGAPAGGGAPAPPLRRCRRRCSSRPGGPLAYRVQVRSGTSTVLGVPLGAPYSTPAYATYRLPCGALLSGPAPVRGGGAAQIVPDESLEVEAVARLSPDGGCLLFVLNRLEAPQSGRLRFPTRGRSTWAPRCGRRCCTAPRVRRGGGDGGVRLDLAPGEALVLRLT